MNNCQTKYQPILIESEGFIRRCSVFFLFLSPSCEICS